MYDLVKVDALRMELEERLRAAAKAGGYELGEFTHRLTEKRVLVGAVGLNGKDYAFAAALDGCRI